MASRPGREATLVHTSTTTGGYMDKTWKLTAEWSEGDNAPVLLEMVSGFDDAHGAVEKRDADNDWPEGCDVILTEPDGHRWVLSPENAGWNCETHAYSEKADRYCGAKKCRCGDHKGLVRCYCGWARDGGNGREQLTEMGERIDDE